MSVNGPMTVLLSLFFILSCSKKSLDPDNNSNNEPPPSSEWKWIARSLMSTARQEILPGILNDKIYIIGGLGNQGQVLSLVEVYDPGTDSWSTATNLPVERHHVATASAHAKLYAIGGFEGIYPWVATDDVYEYDPATDSWTEKASMPTARGEHVAAVYNGKIYVIGGRTEEMDLYETPVNEMYDPLLDHWSTRASMNHTRTHSAISVIDSLIYVIGGRYSEGTNIINVPYLEAYSPQHNIWIELHDMPEFLGGLSAGTLGKRLFTIGGESFSPDVAHDDNFQYNPVTDKWSVSKKIPTPRHGTGAALVGDTLYVIGGANHASYSPTAANEGFFMETHLP